MLLCDLFLQDNPCMPGMTAMRQHDQKNFVFDENLLPVVCDNADHAHSPVQSYLWFTGRVSFARVITIATAPFEIFSSSFKSKCSNLSFDE